ncbi:DNA ligase [Acidaminobacter hydrogenoformans]|uniref:DNA ligase n=1 Tax=Acidaminobacter hydrogenoformans DSM 2784 TaxID=1120920 RepID=A0A1G5S2R0_9FIRM|nr:DNA ligase [Acidaminobacter hydrogenoformans]SCZ80458.1 hypothetical protein SAMN03080599_02280 [Acidaminobacter hydrogenoformans DSM 2784]
MSKMSEISQVVNELRRCGELLIGISESLTELFSSSEPKASTNESHVPVPEKVITLEEVRSVLSEKSRDGYTAEVRSLLLKYGAEKLSEISPAKYPALLTEAEVLGNG